MKVIPYNLCEGKLVKDFWEVVLAMYTKRFKNVWNSLTHNSISRIFSQENNQRCVYGYGCPPGVSRPSQVGLSLQQTSGEETR